MFIRPPDRRFPTMSHVATKWALKLRGLKPATKIVLLNLADHHNAKTGQCNPMQETLAEECEMSRSTLNVHLAELERLTLIRRNAMFDGKTGMNRPTSYSLSGFKECPASEIRTRAMSGKRTKKPCPENAENHVRNPDSNLGKEPGNLARATGGAKRAMSAIPISGASVENWQAWLKRGDQPRLEVLAERSRRAGEEFWIVPIRSPPAAGDQIGEAVALRWVEQRKGMI